MVGTEPPAVYCERVDMSGDMSEEDFWKSRALLAWMLADDFRATVLAALEI